MSKAFTIEVENKPGTRPALLAERLRSYDDLVNLPQPEISVISCSYNLGRFLEDTIRSVANQSFRNFEHIIIDGGSTDNSVEILKKYPHIRWVSEKDSGYPEAFHKGLKMARGKYIMQCAVSDAYANRNWFKYCVEYLNAHPEVSLVGGLSQTLQENGLAGDTDHRDKNFALMLENKDSFSYFLKAGQIFYEGDLCAYAEIVKNCYPNEQTNFNEIIDWLEFNYNFTKKGYLAGFLSVISGFPRRHEGQIGQQWGRDRKLRQRHKLFLRKMANYRWRVIRGLEQPVFIDHLGRPLNRKFDRIKFLKEYFVYKLSPEYLVSQIKNNYDRTLRLAKRIVTT